jgi:hypothetical protein
MSLPFPVISSWDPRASSSGSIDPLGALRAYNSIAGFLFPGVTTITTRVRYLSWLCAGLRLLDEVDGAPAGGTAARSRRQRLLAWERFLVLATGYYAAESGVPRDAPVWRGLRGISYVRNAIGQGTTTTEFELLKNQSGVGGVGTYWVTMVHGGLVADMSAELTDRGGALADEFLKRLGAPVRSKLCKILAGEVPQFSKGDLVRWGKIVSLDASTASATEIRGLRDALIEPKAQRLMSRTIGTVKAPTSNQDTFKRLERALKKERDDTAVRMAAVMELTRSFERVHAGLLDQFDRIRSLNLRGTPVDRKAAVDAIDLSGKLAERGAELDNCLKNLSALPRETAAPVRQFLENVRPVLEAGTRSVFLQAICSHHARVQAGKLDASRQPKQAWVELLGDNLVIAPIFAIDGVPKPRDASAFTHPYRIESFAGMLSEVQPSGADA